MDNKQMDEMERQGIIRKPPVEGRKFYAVDLDGVLSFYDRYRGRDHIGKPIPTMVKRVQDWLADGNVVVVFTSRVADSRRDDHAQVLSMIHKWCEEHIGERLFVTATKERWMNEIWDDQAVRVERNTGRVL